MDKFPLILFLEINKSNLTFYVGKIVIIILRAFIN